MRKFSKLLLTLALSMLAIQPAFAQQVYKADVIVVGSGMAGSSAAAAAAEKGLDTILIEQLPGLGGVGHFVEGSFAVGSRLQSEAMVDLDRSKAFVQIMDYAHWKVDGSLVKRVVDYSAPTIAWLEDKGIMFTAVHRSYVGGNEVYHNYETVNPGKHFANTLAKVVTDNGGKVFTEMRAYELITNKKGEVVGVWATDEEDEKVRFDAKAVILATGSFTANKELRAKYTTVPENIKTLTLPKNDGQGLLMGLSVGADTADMNTIIWEGAFPVNRTYGELWDEPYLLDMYMALKSKDLWVNQAGYRFLNESFSGDFTIVSNSLMMHDNIQIAILNEDMVEDLKTGQGAHTGYFTMFQKGQKLKYMDQAIADGLKNGYAFKANSIKDLAKQLGMDPKVLEATVERYNELAQAGNDTDFGKSAEFMRPLTEGPYYAFKGINTICDSMGGLKINRNAQVLDTKGQPIKGLYAAGNVSGGMVGSDYHYIAPGYASTIAMTTGRFAAEHIADELD